MLAMGLSRSFHRWVCCIRCCVAVADESTRRQREKEQTAVLALKLEADKTPEPAAAAAGQFEKTTNEEVVVASSANRSPLVARNVNQAAHLRRHRGGHKRRSTTKKNNSSSSEASLAWEALERERRSRKVLLAKAVQQWASPVNTGVAPPHEDGFYERQLSKYAAPLPPPKSRSIDTIDERAPTPSLPPTPPSQQHVRRHRDRDAVRKEEEATQQQQQQQQQHQHQHTLLADNIVTAAIEGDARELSRQLSGSGELSHDGRAVDVSRLRCGALPLLTLHRSVSGFHFHGSQRLLIQTLRVLLEHNADINGCDHNGNTALHKVLQVCTSTAVVTVSRCLLQNGADPKVRNVDGETALHAEIRRLRCKSVEVVDLLCSYGAAVNATNKNGFSPLMLALHSAQKRGIEVSSSTSDAVVGSTSGELSATARAPATTSLSCSGRNFWVPVAHALVRHGALWDGTHRDTQGRTQLHLLFSGPAPPPQDGQARLALVKSILEHTAGAAEVLPRVCDRSGNTVLHLFVRQEQSVSGSAAAVLHENNASAAILALLLEHGADPHAVNGDGLSVASFVEARNVSWN
jgi:hypothetical protein